MTDIKRICYGVILETENFVDIVITEQTGWRSDGADALIFKSKNIRREQGYNFKVEICSMSFPHFYDECIDMGKISLYVRGHEKSMDRDKVRIPKKYWRIIEETIREFNEMDDGFFVSIDKNLFEI
jgi:hypothetical protein